MTTYTKEERVSLIRAKQDIVLFLRLARMRIDALPDVLPFKAATGNLVLSWLLALAERYGQGEDITEK